MSKLTQEHLEYLNNLIEDRDGVKVLLSLLEESVHNRETEAGRTQVVPGKESEVLYRHLRAEGARQLYNEVVAILVPKTKKKS